MAASSNIIVIEDSIRNTVVDMTYKFIDTDVTADAVLASLDCTSLVNSPEEIRVCFAEYTMSGASAYLDLSDGTTSVTIASIPEAVYGCTPFGGSGIKVDGATTISVKATGTKSLASGEQGVGHLILHLIKE